MKILILVVGATNDLYTKEACEVFFRRLKHYVKLEYKEIPDLKKVSSMSKEQRKSKEGEKILSFIEPRDYLVLLDEKGEGLTSRQFSKFLDKKMVAGVQRLVFVVGGAFGFSDDVYEKSKAMLSLSKMTFSHQMIRVFMLEQLYRAFTILRNEPYHND